MRILSYLLVMLITSAASAADVASDQPATQWLDKMSQAMRSINYDMAVVVQHGGKAIEPYRWRHGLVEGQSVEHLSLLNGPGRDIVRVGSQVSYYEPNVPAFSLASSSISGPFPATLLYDPQKLSVSYEFVLVGRSRVTGRATQQIRIVSKDNSRYGFSLWLDQETALPLKLDMLDNKGNVLEQVQVTAMQVTPTASEAMQNIAANTMPDLVQLKEQTAGSHPWYAGWLPDGMEEIKRDRHRLSVSGNPVDYLLFSDGLIDVSVYVQAAGSNESTQAFRFGSDTFFSTQVGQLLVTVVGKLPPQTADKIAQSLVAKVPAP